MTWPYISKEVINAGTDEEPDYREMPKLLWIPSSDKGPYQPCKQCRDTRDEINAKFLLAHPEEKEVYESSKGQPLQRREPKYPPFKMNYSLPGSANCFKHSVRFYRDLLTQGCIPQAMYDEKISFLEKQEGIHARLRGGAYYEEN